jgi:hypothetical protein
LCCALTDFHNITILGIRSTRFDQSSLYFPAAAINVLHSDELPIITSDIKYNFVVKADILKIAVSIVLSVQYSEYSVGLMTAVRD